MLKYAYDSRMENVYFADASVLLYAHMSKQRIRQINGSSLKDHLNAHGIIASTDSLELLL
jgi:hypothetical protein